MSTSKKDLEVFEIALRLEDENQKLRSALEKLSNEAKGFLSMARIETHGLTNMNVLNLRIKEASEVLSKLDRE